MSDNLKKTLNIFGYVFIFFVSLVFFLIFTFPYDVLKDAITANAGKATGLDIRVEELAPTFPLGFEFTGVSVGKASGGPKLSYRSIEADISVLSLLIGQLGVDLELTDKKGGVLEVETGLSLFGLAFNNVFIPSKLVVNVDKFDMSQIASFGLSYLASEGKVNPLFSGMLTQIGIKGKLAGNVDLNLQPDNLAQSSGAVDLKIVNAVLRMDNPSLEMAEQKFKKAIIKANMRNGSLNISKTSGFHTQELMIDFSGNVKLQKIWNRSSLDVAIALKLDKGLKEQFGFFIDAAGGSEGSVKYRVRGTIGRPDYITL